LWLFDRLWRQLAHCLEDLVDFTGEAKLPITLSTVDGTLDYLMEPVGYLLPSHSITHAISFFTLTGFSSPLTRR
jgi:hypothetical protein